MADYVLLVREYENPYSLSDSGISEFRDEVITYLKKGYTCVGAPFKEYRVRDKEVEEYASPSVSRKSRVTRGVNHTIWYQALYNKDLNYHVNSAKSAETAGGERRQRKTLRKRK